MREPGEPSRARGWIAAAAVPGVAVASCAAYDAAPPPVADVAILPYAALLLLAPAFVHPWLRAHGVSLAASAGAALALCLGWIAKELWAISAVYSPGETLFYALNPVPLGLFTASVFQIAVAELCLRQRRSLPLRGPALVVAAILLLGLGVALAARGSGGREIFYGYVALHARLFPR